MEYHKTKRRAGTASIVDTPSRTWPCTLGSGTNVSLTEGEKTQERNPRPHAAHRPESRDVARLEPRRSALNLVYTRDLKERRERHRHYLSSRTRTRALPSPRQAGARPSDEEREPANAVRGAALRQPACLVTRRQGKRGLRSVTQYGRNGARRRGAWPPVHTLPWRR